MAEGRSDGRAESFSREEAMMNRRGFLKAGAGAGIGAGVAVAALAPAGCRKAPTKETGLQKLAAPTKVDPQSFAESAVKHFLPGKRTCGESILMAACEALGVESELVPNAALGLAGGVGLQGGTCGAVTGAAIVLGLVAGARESEYPKRFARVQKAVGAFVRRFEDELATTSCRDLVGLDLTTPEGMEALKAGAKAEKCGGFVRTAARILAEGLENA